MRKHNYKRGDKIGKITFIKKVERESNKDHTRGVFMCYCGEVFITRISYVKDGRTSSCGCYRKKAAVERQLIVISEETMLAIEKDFKLNEVTLVALSRKYSLSTTKLGRLRTKYYARI